MTWRKGVGGEFLYHYRVDAETSKKKWIALGKRSAETEKAYNDFISRRDDARHWIIVVFRCGIIRPALFFEFQNLLAR